MDVSGVPRLKTGIGHFKPKGAGVSGRLNKGLI